MNDQLETIEEESKSYLTTQQSQEEPFDGPRLQQQPAGFQQPTNKQSNETIQAIQTICSSSSQNSDGSSDVVIQNQSFILIIIVFNSLQKNLITNQNNQVFIYTQYYQSKQKQRNIKSMLPMKKHKKGLQLMFLKNYLKKNNILTYGSQKKEEKDAQILSQGDQQIKQMRLERSERSQKKIQEELLQMSKQISEMYKERSEMQSQMQKERSEMQSQMQKERSEIQKERSEIQKERSEMQKERSEMQSQMQKERSEMQSQMQKERSEMYQERLEMLREILEMQKKVEEMRERIKSLEEKNDQLQKFQQDEKNNQ
ncbi:hypothetical protein ABPG72_005705 [Tetrahymena utriculariae]